MSLEGILLQKYPKKSVPIKEHTLEPCYENEKFGLQIVHHFDYHPADPIFAVTVPTL